jgi:hypothetical protein
MNKVIKPSRNFLNEEFSLEEKLETIGLGKNQVERYQTVEELENSLNRLNDYVSEINFSPFTMSGVFINRCINERKKLILDRICFLKGEQIKTVVEDTSENHSKEEIRDQVDSLVAGMEEAKKEARKIDEDEKESEKNFLAQEEMKIKSRESTSKIWLSFLAKESMASILGGLLLLAILIAQLIAIFQNLKVPDILNNSFLVILGYFFGQSANKKSSDKEQS